MKMSDKKNIADKKKIYGYVSLVEGVFLGHVAVDGLVDFPPPPTPMAVDEGRFRMSKRD